MLRCLPRSRWVFCCCLLALSLSPSLLAQNPDEKCRDSFEDLTLGELPSNGTKNNFQIPGLDLSHRILTREEVSEISVPIRPAQVEYLQIVLRNRIVLKKILDYLSKKKFRYGAITQNQTRKEINARLKEQFLEVRTLLEATLAKSWAPDDFASSPEVSQIIDKIIDFNLRWEFIESALAESQLLYGAITESNAEAAASFSEQTLLSPERYQELNAEAQSWLSQLHDRTQTLFDHNQRLVVSIATWVMKTTSLKRELNLTLRDLIGEGLIGLMVAAHRYDPRMGTAFSTYAFRPILNAIKTAIRSARAGTFLSTYRVGNGEGFLLEPKYDANKEVITGMEAREILASLDILDPRARYIVEARLGLYENIKTMPELAKELGITRQRVEQIQNEAFKQIAKQLSSRYGED